MGQLPQPHPQEDFPFLWFRIIEAIIAATAAAKAAHIMTVPKFSDIHASMTSPPVKNIYIVTLTSPVSFVASL